MAFHEDRHRDFAHLVFPEQPDDLLLVNRLRRIGTPPVRHSLASRSIKIADAYLVPESQVVATLVDARRRGVAVDIVVPGPVRVQEGWARMLRPQL